MIGIAGGTINMIANPNLLKWLTNSYLRKKSENKSSYKIVGCVLFVFIEIKNNIKNRIKKYL